MSLAIHHPLATMLDDAAPGSPRSPTAWSRCTGPVGAV